MRAAPSASLKALDGARQARTSGELCVRSGPPLSFFGRKWRRHRLGPALVIAHSPAHVARTRARTRAPRLRAGKATHSQWHHHGPEQAGPSGWTRGSLRLFRWLPPFEAPISLSCSAHMRQARLLSQSCLAIPLGKFVDVHRCAKTRLSHATCALAFHGTTR